MNLLIFYLIGVLLTSIFAIADLTRDYKHNYGYYKSTRKLHKRDKIIQERNRFYKRIGFDIIIILTSWLYVITLTAYLYYKTIKGEIL